ncbi:MAG TPA: hypothetical protein VII57_05960 [Dehalococcoidia bacterium]
MALTDAQTGGVIKEFAGKVKVTLAGTVVAGDLLGYSSGWKRALATVGTAIQGRLVALEGGVSGDEIEAAAAAVIGGRISGATPGGAVYGAEGTSNGQYTETAPSTTGDVATIIGRILDATTIIVWPENRAPVVV